MSDGSALINLGELSKPATILIEKISSAVGVLYEPTRIRRKARADADAEKIQALARIELLSELEERALERLVHQEARKQRNIESITAQAVTQLTPSANVEQLDEDWIAHFFEQCDTVSDAEMQTLWAKLLAGEASNPGSFSKRTIDLVASLSKREAELFTALGAFVWDFAEPTVLVFDPAHALLQQKGLDFATLTHFNVIGLVNFNSLTGFAIPDVPRRVTCAYHGTRLELTLQQDAGNTLGCGQVLLTEAGKQLFPVCGSMGDQQHFQSVVARWSSSGIQVAIRS